MSAVAAISGWEDQALLAAIAKHGSQSAFAGEMGIDRKRVKRELDRRGLTLEPRAAQRRGVPPTLSRDALHAALLPPNNCQVKAFRDTLDENSRDVLDEALGYDKRDFPASRVREFLISQNGVLEPDVPGVDAINAHRSGQRPCRCKG